MKPILQNQQNWSPAITAFQSSAGLFQDKLTSSEESYCTSGLSYHSFTHLLYPKKGVRQQQQMLFMN